ncbi:E6-LIKE PROTEIN [Salix koriyanagi]|uniref:E6-LIKE PROTEIN n=1 Tax=Salix koriyanagi TaxID=2511006 RepID=A0A9Q0ZBM9_9ROSI|nr:E6-LIKE PROTEIN [Salix koriyanagi]
MADPSPTVISALFLLAIFSVQIHARESQFFSKVSAAVATPSTTTINNNNAQDKTLPTKEDEELSKQDLDPAFIRDNQNGYDTTTTTTTTKPNTKYYSNNAYEEEQQQNFGETSLEESGYTSTGNQNGNNYYYSGANGYSNDEKLGMSDTRYLEKGKYYYDVNNENRNLNPNQYQLQNSRNNYNTGGYYSNNNENSKYEYDNSMQKYDSQDGFGESKEEQYVP